MKRARSRPAAARRRLTFHAAVRDVLDDYRMNGRRSLADVERHVRLHLAPAFGRRRLADIGAADVRRYVLARQRAGARNATINRELSVLKRAFALAAAAGRLTARPHVALLRENNVRRGFFEADEFAAVRRALPPDLADLVSFLYVTGWRWRSEAARLRWTDVDFAAGEVRLEPGTTKTGEGRTFPFTTALRDLLARRRAGAPDGPSALVFTRADGTPVRSFTKAWATACRRAGVAGRVLHDFRRTAIRNLLRAGIPERVAMQLVGWKSRQMLDRYHIVSAADFVDAARKLDAAAATSDRDHGLALRAAPGYPSGMRLALVPWSDSAPATDAALRADLAAAGLDVFAWSDSAGATYTPHKHDHDETIVLVAGDMTFVIGGRDYTLGCPGDRLLLPAGTVHAARAGRAGATYLIGSAAAR